MTEKEAKKHIAASMPAILTGTAALIAALTTTYISVRGDASPVSAKPQITASAPTVANPPDAGVIGTTPPVVAQPVVAAAVQSMRLKVERIAVHSDGPGHGTEFTVHLPLRAAPESAPRGVAPLHTASMHWPLPGQKRGSHARTQRRAVREAAGGRGARNPFHGHLHTAPSDRNIPARCCS